jgi:hypothetical protein
VKLSHGAPTGLWAVFVGYAAYVTWWVLLPRPDESSAFKVMVLVAAAAIALGVFVIVLRRLPAFGRPPQLSPLRFGLVILGFAISLAVFSAIQVAFPGSTHDAEARSAISNAAALFSGWVLALTPAPSEANSHRAALSRRLDAIGRLLDGGRVDEPEASEGPG